MDTNRFSLRKRNGKGPEKPERETRGIVQNWFEDQPYLNKGIITNGLLVVVADTDEGVQ